MRLMCGRDPISGPDVLWCQNVMGLAVPYGSNSGGAYLGFGVPSYPPTGHVTLNCAMAILGSPDLGRCDVPAT